MEHDLLKRWIEQFKSGDNSPMVQVMEDHGDYCIAKLQRPFLNCQPEDAEDVFMDSLMIFRENMIKGRIVELDNLRGYIYIICKNLFLKKYHKKKTENEKQDDLMRYYYLHRYDVESYDQLEMEERNKEKEAEKKARIAQLYSTLLTLSEKCQKILKLFYIEKKSMEEITEELKKTNKDTTKDTTKTTKYRCFKKLKLGIN